MKNKTLLASSLMMAMLLAGCNDDDNNRPPSRPTITPLAPLVGGSQFDVTVLNNTSAQPFSPVAFISSSKQNEVFELGRTASLQLERLAEDGDNTKLLIVKGALPEVDIHQSGLGPIQPGTSQTTRLSVGNPQAKHLTVASMLVNTNDGFFAEEFDLSTIKVGQTIIFKAPVWDAGTELNTETADTIPGPAGNAGANNGFNTNRDDIVDFVTTHRGVISNEDGLTTSDLTSQHRFLNPVVSIRIHRIK